MKTCPNCGASVEDTEKFCPKCQLSLDGAETSTATEEPTATPEAVKAQETVSTPVTSEPTASEPESPKKKHHALKIILAIVIPIVVILLILFVGALIFVHSLQIRSEESVDTYWNYYIESDEAGMTTEIPDAYWDYISETYGYTQEECTQGVGYFMDSLAAVYGENLVVSDTGTSGPYYGYTSMSEMEEVDENMERFGLQYTFAVAAQQNGVILTGDADSYNYGDVVHCMVKIDREWYDYTILMDIDVICEQGYVEQAQYQSTYGDDISTFWTAFYNVDADTVTGMAPDGLWAVTESEYGFDKDGATTCMETYLNDLMSYYGFTDSEISFEVSVTGVTECTDDDMVNLQDFIDELGDNLAADEYVYVDFDYTLYQDGEITESGSSSSNMMLLDGQWYNMECMYLILDACLYCS
ncbi:MAG: zinc-ribbon domain-containing protein [Ruminococcus sp.]|nr:zinc-ribbon domain-containing protein [Ruminococcus sp.]